MSLQVLTCVDGEADCYLMSAAEGDIVGTAVESMTPEGLESELSYEYVTVHGDRVPLPANPGDVYVARCEDGRVHSVVTVQTSPAVVHHLTEHMMRNIKR